MLRTRMNSSRSLVRAGAISPMVLAMPAVADQAWSAWSPPVENIGDPDLEPDVFGLEVNMD